MAKQTRLGGMAEQLAALLEFRNRPIGVAEEVPVEPGDIPAISTNWRIVPEGDYVLTSGIDYRQEITPTISEIERAMAEVEFVTQREAKLGGGGRKVLVARGGDVERSESGSVVRMGRLRFSDGTQVERAMVKDAIGNVVEGAARLPVGAMIGGEDRSTRAKGGTQAPDTSNAYFAEVLGTERPRYVKGGQRRPRRDTTNPPLPPTSMTLAEAREFAGLPTADKLPTGLPCGSPRVADSFIGMRKAACKGDLIPWQDLSGGIAGREAWIEAWSATSERDKAVLEATSKARNVTDVGMSAGFSSGRAKRGGMKALLAANDNLASAIRKCTS